MLDTVQNPISIHYDTMAAQTELQADYLSDIIHTALT